MLSQSNSTLNANAIAEARKAQELEQEHEYVGIQVLQQLIDHETKTVEKIRKITEAYTDPSKEFLTFQQHFSIFSNFKSLGESQHTLLVKLHAIVARCRGAAARETAMILKGSKNESGIGGTPTSLNSAHERSDSIDTTGSNDSILIRPGEEYIFEGVVKDFFLDPTMNHFLAEHMMFTLNFCRGIAPSLLDLASTRGSSAAINPKLVKFVEFVTEMASRIAFSGTLLPEHDLLGAQQEELKQRSPIEELCMLLAVSLPSLRRFVHVGRCLIETEGCLSISDRDELIEGFVRPLSSRILEEVGMVRECITNQHVKGLLMRMEDFTAPALENRVLLHHGNLVKKFSRGRHERLALLFSDVFCYVEDLSDGKWKVRGLVSLESKIDLRDVDDCFYEQLSNCFEMITSSNKYVFFAASANEKQEWMKQLDKAIAAVKRKKMTGAPLGSEHSTEFLDNRCIAMRPKSRLARQKNEDLRRGVLQNAVHISAGGGNEKQGEGSNDNSSIGSHSHSFASRKAARGSFNYTTWSTQQAEKPSHFRVKSVDLLTGGSQGLHSRQHSLGGGSVGGVESPGLGAQTPNESFLQNALHTTLPPPATGASGSSGATPVTGGGVGIVSGGVSQLGKHFDPSQLFMETLVSASNTATPTAGGAGSQRKDSSATTPPTASANTSLVHEKDPSPPSQNQRESTHLLDDAWDNAE